ncbi:GAF and ANTAR domain-containing protein [Actinomycetospora flava]|uniref:GAF and ANTAR domain-containing protein n=1 Tax=Actinomycetospora flava TaxID=3129232 RepID=A0ABU8M8W0_9PSEU
MTADMQLAHLRRTTFDLNHRAGARNHVQALARIHGSALAVVAGADSAGLTLLDERYEAFTRATEVPVVGTLDALQREVDGPARTVLTEPPADGVVRATDLAGDDGERWPEFAARALDAGCRSMLSVRVEVDGGPRLALNLYGTEPAAFDDRARHAAGVLAMSAGMLLLAADHTAQLQQALDTRDTIGRAKGVLMERFGLDQDEAFAKLREASQETNMKLCEVARWLGDESDTMAARRRDLGTGEPAPPTPLLRSV